MAADLCLGLDYGSRRIGVAVGSPATGQARALPALHHKQAPDWHAIETLMTEWQPAACVVGLPLNEDGSEQAITAVARTFAKRLEQRCGVPVHLCDERFSSRSADAVIRRARAAGHLVHRTRKGQRDSIAACLILEQFFAGS